MKIVSRLVIVLCGAVSITACDNETAVSEAVIQKPLPAVIFVEKQSNDVVAKDDVTEGEICKKIPTVCINGRFRTK